MRDMRVLALRADSGACAYYRINEPVRAVSDLYNVDITVDTSLPVEAYVDRNNKIVIEKVMTDVDVVIFQRPLLGSFVDGIQACQKRGIACVVELDDDFSAVHPENIAYAGMQPRNNSIANYSWVAKAASIADWVTVSTPALARKYGSHGRVSVLRNNVPQSIFDIDKKMPDDARVGWSGAIQTHPRDLDVAGTHVGTAVKRWGTEFNVVGDSSRVREKLYIPHDIPVNQTGWVPLDEYYETLAANIDVGIVPLELSPFNNAKSYLKGLEMAALGIPFVASPTEEYRWLAMKGVGVLASKGSEWQKHLKHLLTDRDFMLERSAAYRESVATYTYENHAEEWVVAWLHALAHRKKNPA